MPHFSTRTALTLAALTSLTAACSGDQKAAQAPEQPPAEAPADTSTPQPGDATMPQPNGQPTETPPDAPPPQGLNEGKPDNTLASPGVSATTPGSTLSEGQIAMIVDLANTAEIEQGKLALSKAKSASVKKFATKMVKHHTEAKNEGTKIAKQLNVTPSQSQEASSLKSDADAALGKLRGATGAAFDVAYIDGQVDAHRDVLALIDQQLLPSAKSEQAVSALKRAREVVAAHLEEAKTIQADLASKK